MCGALPRLNLDSMPGRRRRRGAAQRGERGSAAAAAAAAAAAHGAPAHHPGGVDGVPAAAAAAAASGAQSLPPRHTLAADSGLMKRRGAMRVRTRGRGSTVLGAANCAPHTFRTNTHTPTLAAHERRLFSFHRSSRRSTASRPPSPLRRCARTPRAAPPAARAPAPTSTPQRRPPTRATRRGRGATSARRCSRRLAASCSRDLRRRRHRRLLLLGRLAAAAALARARRANRWRTRQLPPSQSLATQAHSSSRSAAQLAA